MLEVHNVTASAAEDLHGSISKYENEPYKKPCKKTENDN